MSPLRKSDMSVQGLRELPSLTHLHSPQANARDAVQYIAQHLGDRLTFLRLGIDVPLSPSVAVQYSALRSLYINVRTKADSLHTVLEQLHLPPQLSELTIADCIYGTELVLALHSLPAHLKYLQVRCCQPILGAAHLTVGTSVHYVLTLLPPLLLCLSLTMPSAAISDTLLSSLPTLCAQLTHCHIGVTDEDHGEMKQRQQEEWRQRLPALRSQLGAGVWRETMEAVEQQRMDMRWQREVGVQMREKY